MERDRRGPPDVRWVPGAAHALAAEAIARALREVSEPRIAVPGGRSAAAVFGALAGLGADASPDWRRVRLFFVDERAVPPDHPESNYRLARESLIEPLGIPAGHVHRMRGEDPDLEAAARDYAGQLPQALDVMLLGVGEDGHVASLFPGSPLLAERARKVAVVERSPKPPEPRLTITPPVIEAARVLIVVAEGESKRAAVLRALSAEGDTLRTPARLARHGRWFVGDMGPPLTIAAG